MTDEEEKMSLPSDIRVLSAESHIEHVTARSPLKFGAVVVKESTSCQVKVKVENREGEVVEGIWGCLRWGSLGLP